MHICRQTETREAFKLFATCGAAECLVIEDIRRGHKVTLAQASLPVVVVHTETVDGVRVAKACAVTRRYKNRYRTLYEVVDV